MSSASRGARTSSAQACHSVLHVEMLEDRWLLSASPELAASPFVAAEAPGDIPIHFSHVAGQADAPATVGNFVEWVGPDRLASERLDGNTIGLAAPGADGPPMRDELISLPAIEPDESIDPFVDCPGVEEKYCLPKRIEPDHDALIFIPADGNGSPLEDAAVAPHIVEVGSIPNHAASVRGSVISPLSGWTTTSATAGLANAWPAGNS